MVGVVGHGVGMQCVCVCNGKQAKNSDPKKRVHPDKKIKMNRMVSAIGEWFRVVGLGRQQSCMI